ncbi:aldehyde dehydrogenase family protein [Priestia endophytica]
MPYVEIWNQEIFAPMLSIVQVKRLEEAIETAN